MQKPWTKYCIEYWVSPYMRCVIHQTKPRLVLGIQSWFKIQELIIVIHYIVKSQMILIDTNKLFDKIQHTCVILKLLGIKRIFFSLIKVHYNKAPSGQGYGFSSGRVWMWELDYKESWAPKNWCFWTVVLEETFESPLDHKEIKPVHPKGNQSWIFIGRTDAEASILWQPDAKNWLSGKDPDAGKDWG